MPMPVALPVALPQFEGSGGYCRQGHVRPGCGGGGEGGEGYGEAQVSADEHRAAGESC